MRDETEDQNIDQVITFQVSIGSSGVSIQSFIDGLFQYCNHDYFRHTKPSIEQRILALRFAAHSLELEAKILEVTGIAPTPREKLKGEKG